jgi:hypothetical protein
VPHSLHLTLQNNQLQELPYNELSRLSGLQTLDLHGNLISSEGEGLGGRGPSLPAGLRVALWRFPERHFAEYAGNLGAGGGAAAFEQEQGGGGGQEDLNAWELLQVPSPQPWGAESTVLHPQAWGPLTTLILPHPLLPGLPDEAFESLPQLQYLYVAHNKVSSSPERVQPGQVTQHWDPGT